MDGFNGRFQGLFRQADFVWFSSVYFEAPVAD
jgi:hypothetical protein